MIFGIGIDKVDVARVAMQLQRQAGLREQLFTEREIRYCESRRHGAQHYAARFAAKEAFLKALGTGWRDGLAFSDIEIVNDESGKPACVVHGAARRKIEEHGITAVHVSLTHLPEIAGAVVMLEK